MQPSQATQNEYLTVNEAKSRSWIWLNGVPSTSQVPPVVEPVSGHSMPGGNVTVVEVVNEKLRPGPVGRLVRVVDYDAATGNYYAPVDLDAK